MQMTMNYSDFVESSPSLSSASANLSDQVEMDLDVIPSTTVGAENLCKIILKDKIGVDEISETINKEDIRELLTIFKIIYNQLLNMDNTSVTVESTNNTQTGCVNNNITQNRYV